MIVMVIVACSTPKRGGEPNGTGSATMDKTMKRDGGTSTVFVRGVAVVPVDKLVAWLDAQKLDGKPRLLRFPIVLSKASGEFDISSARLGADPAALVVYANDAALGNGLADRAISACKGREICAFWVEGYWQGKQELGYQVDVMRVQATIGPEELASATQVEVEGETGN